MLSKNDQRPYRRGIGAAIGAFYGLMIGLVVSFIVQPWITIPKEDFQFVIGNVWQIRSFSVSPVIPSGGLWFFVSPHAIFSGFLLGTMRGRYPKVVATVGLACSLGIAIALRWNGCHCGNHFWLLLFLQITVSLTSVLLNSLVFRITDWLRRDSLVRLARSETPGASLSTLSSLLVVSSLGLSVLTFLDAGGMGEAFLIPVALLHIAALVSTLHLTASYPNCERLASRLRAVLFVWVALVLTSVVVLSFGAVHGRIN